MGFQAGGIRRPASSSGGIMHGLIFFYLQKFTETLSTGAPAGSR